jgi:hypothetical protein
MGHSSFESDEEVRVVSAWMQELGQLPANEAPLPDPALLWWKAELLRRWDTERRVAEPIERGEPVQVAIGLIGAVVLLLWLWRAPSSGGMILTIATTVSTALLVALAVFTLRNFFPRDF